MVVLHAAACGQRPALRLRPWCEQDIPELIDIYRDRDMRRQARTAISTHEDAQQWLEIQRKGWRDGDRLSFAVLEWTAGRHRAAGAAASPAVLLPRSPRGPSRAWTLTGCGT
jgi:RimJ/RimL family protein N-acetyltransferase